MLPAKKNLIFHKYLNYYLEGLYYNQGSQSGYLFLRLFYYNPVNDDLRRYQQMISQQDANPSLLMELLLTKKYQISENKLLVKHDKQVLEVKMIEKQMANVQKLELIIELLIKTRVSKLSTKQVTNYRLTQTKYKQINSIKKKRKFQNYFLLIKRGIRYPKMVFKRWLIQQGVDVRGFKVREVIVNKDRGIIPIIRLLKIDYSKVNGQFFKGNEVNLIKL